MYHKFFSVLCVMLVMTLALPAGAMAAAFEDPIWVLDTNVNDSSGTSYFLVKRDGSFDVLTTNGASASNYNVKFERSTKTLTFNNVQATAAKTSSDQYILLQTKENITICLEGENEFSRNFSQLPMVNWGIRHHVDISWSYTPGTLTITGDGTLTLKSTVAGIASDGPLKIQSGTINIDVSNSRKTSIFGVRVAGVDISGGNVNISMSGGDQATSGANLILAGEGGGSVTIKNANVVLDLNRSGGSTTGISAGSINVENSDVLLKANNTGNQTK